MIDADLQVAVAQQPQQTSSTSAVLTLGRVAVADAAAEQGDTLAGSSVRMTSAGSKDTSPSYLNRAQRVPSGTLMSATNTTYHLEGQTVARHPAQAMLHSASREGVLIAAGSSEEDRASPALPLPAVPPLPACPPAHRTGDGNLKAFRYGVMTSERQARLALAEAVQAMRTSNNAWARAELAQ